ncbi:MAG: hypothetical protein R6X27_06470 [Candidatus Desulfacyla sp.]
MSSSALGSQATANAVNWDFDIRCCADGQVLSHAFYIELVGLHDSFVAELQVETPDDAVLGAERGGIRYYPPQEHGLYLLGERPDKPITSASWDFRRVLILFPLNLTHPTQGYLTFRKRFRDDSIYRLKQGEYRLRVMGRFSGKYVLKVCPLGRETPDACFGIGQPDGIEITASEEHLYSFEGRNAPYWKDGQPVIEGHFNLLQRDPSVD